MRLILAEDSALLREGLSRALATRGLLRVRSARDGGKPSPA